MSRSIRSVMIDGEPRLVGRDVAAALGYSNPQKAIRDHVDDEDRTVNESFTVNGTQGTIINESGLYALILSSKLPQAKRFKRWVCGSDSSSHVPDTCSDSATAAITRLAFRFWEIAERQRGEPGAASEG